MSGRTKEIISIGLRSDVLGAGGLCKRSVASCCCCCWSRAEPDKTPIDQQLVNKSKFASVFLKKKKGHPVDKSYPVRDSSPSRQNKSALHYFMLATCKCWNTVSNSGHWLEHLWFAEDVYYQHCIPATGQSSHRPNARLQFLSDISSEVRCLLHAGSSCFILTLKRNDGNINGQRNDSSLKMTLAFHAQRPPFCVL